MANRINNNYNLSNIIQQAEKIKQTDNSIEKNKLLKTDKSFKELLNKELNNSVTFSKHANQRSIERNIEVTDSDIVRLGDACDRVKQKGIKDALIVMNDSAYIVNAPNKTVITVVDKNEMKSNIFTNIDGALFI